MPIKSFKFLINSSIIEFEIRHTWLTKRKNLLQYLYMRQKKRLFTNYDFFVRTDTSKYKGEWIAITKNRVVAHGLDAEKVYKKALKKAKKEEVSLAKVPERQMLILKLSLP